MPKAKSKNKTKPKSRSSLGLIKGGKFKFNKSLVIVIAAVVVATGGYLYYRTSHAATVVACTLQTWSTGSTGHCVSDIQGMIARNVTVNGTYDKSTKDAVFFFQAYLGLKADGIVSLATWQKLCTYRGNSGDQAYQLYSIDAGCSQIPTHGKAKPLFVYYYMWWDKHHWTSHLGTKYPYATIPNPLPAALDANSCGTVNKYAGNVLTDVSQNLAYDQSNPQTITNDVELATSDGITGFAVNWIGDGTANQSPTWSYNARLAAMVAAVHKVNAEGKPFKIMLNYQSSAKILTMTQFNNDLNYLLSHYQNDPALDHTYSLKPEIILAGTWKYSDANVKAISAAFRPRMYLIGDEKPASWDAARAASWDGATYYWSSQDPYKNAASFTQLKNFATNIRATKNPDGASKIWLSPFTAGYNAMLVYNTPTCVPRDGTQTAHTLFDGNLASNPDGWAFISWNEISEGSYIVPLTRYGTKYTDTLKAIIQTGK